jgi:hypothetical protein
MASKAHAHHEAAIEEGTQGVPVELADMHSGERATIPVHPNG